MTDDFHSPSRGRVSFGQMVESILDVVGAEPDRSHRLIVGTDSVLRQGHTMFVTAVLVHRVGSGGRYFYRRVRERAMNSLRQRMLHEASMSLELAGRLASALADAPAGDKDMPIEIHLDVGMNGETKRAIREVVGMVAGSGFEAVTKPDAVGASHVADRHARS